VDLDLSPMQQFLTLHLWAQLLIVGLPLIAICVAVTYRAIKRDSSERGNDNVSTVIMRFVGAAFVFLGAFAIVTAWQSASSGIADVQEEFSSITAMSQDAQSVTTDGSLALQDKLLAYAREVANVELVDAPTLQTGERSTELVADISRAVAQLEDSGELSPAIVDSLYSDFNDFKVARNTRLAHTGALLPDSLMWSLLLIEAIMVAAGALYPTGPDRVMKWVQSLSILAVVIAILGVVFSIESGDLSREKFLHPVHVFLEAHTE
jgi:hypothetical protein